MKKIWLSVIFITSLSNSVWGIQCDVQTQIFYINKNPYLEINFYVPTEDLKKAYRSDSSFNHRVGLSIFLKNKLGVIRAEKLLLEDSYSNNALPMLHALRWAISPGTYELETKIYEQNDDSLGISILKWIEVPSPSDSIILSDIQLFAKVQTSKDSSSPMAKRGFSYEPLSYQIALPTLNVLPIYVETYHTQILTDPFYYIIMELYLMDSLNQETLIEKWIKRREKTVSDYILQQKDISHIPSGRYVLKISVADKNQKKYCSSGTEFFRMNPFWDRLLRVKYANEEDDRYFQGLSDDSIHVAIKSLYTLISSSEQSFVDQLINEKRLEGKRMYVYHFWRDQAGDSARHAFKVHMELVNQANRMFYSGFGYGFESDRGRIFLRYGKPLEIFKEDIDSGAYPYEIWKYDKIKKTGQNNVKFLFYNPDLGGQNYRLLHSNAYGEIRNPKWELELYKKVIDEFEGENPLDATGVKRSFTRRAREYFNE